MIDLIHPSFVAKLFKRLLIGSFPSGLGISTF